MKTAFIATVLNESGNIKQLLDSLLTQTLQPHEIVIVDAGSTDNTVEILKEYKKKFKGVPFKIIVKEGNRSVGRNTAIKNTRNEIIAVSDADCILDKNWLRSITAPFVDTSIDVVAGYYKPITKNVFQKSLSTYTCVMPDKLSKDFLPSSRSIAFKKRAWEKVGGYPKELDTCEDLTFARKLKENGSNFYIVRKAIVRWPQRKNIFEAFIQFYSYAKGDGQANYIRQNTHLLFARYFIGIVLLIFFFITLNQSLLLLIIASLIFYIGWSITKNFKYVQKIAALYWLPILQISSDIAVISGTLRGLFKNDRV